MRNDLHSVHRPRRVRGTGIVLSAFALLAVLDGGVAHAADNGTAGSFLLIDGGAPAGQPRLAGCDQAMSDLHAALDKAGARNTVLIAPTASGLREALLRFGNAGNGGSNAVLFCGYAAETGGNVFALGTDFSPNDDPALSAVSVRAFSRVAEGKDGLVMLDLHPMAVEGASVAALAGALDGAAGAWSTDSSLSGTRTVVTDRQTADATLIDKVARSGATTPAAIAQAVAQPPAAPAAAAPSVPPPATPVVPPAAQQTARMDAAPPASQPDPAATAAATPPSTPTATAPASAADAGATKTAPSPPGEAGATELAPKPAAEPAPPRKRVHVDPQVRRIQVALLARGLFNGRVNGVNGADTQRGIQHFQALLGHPATGQLTADETKQLTGG